ncbi:hypothetical protein GCM10015535_36040 [Streptomyces gelaticus]|uniref:Uncharacterized protein n=1 Tax=Streptomyces gelaticus TaxID=285446 RepID=A0ABQ2W3G1_9ACTN|nr:hypothetical protein [Streptomyces gelaticus]GGV87057.1 hypothetical protein GCM10015535_36040 [Streptomyces gelaticus]
MAKICKQCQESKTLDGFRKDGRTRDGLRKVCEDCRSASKSLVAAPAGKETTEQQEGSQGVTQSLIERIKNLSDPRKTFREMTEGLETPSLNVPNLPWPFKDGWDLTEEQGAATDGILIALLHGDSLGSQLLLEEVCPTWIDVVAIQSHIIEALIQVALPDTDKERVIRVCQGMISERETQG